MRLRRTRMRIGMEESILKYLTQRTLHQSIHKVSRIKSHCLNGRLERGNHKIQKRRGKSYIVLPYH